MNSDFTIYSKLIHNHLVIETSGYINIHGGDSIAKVAFSHIDLGVKKIILNLGHSKVINSVGISILIEIIEKLQAVDGTLYFTNMSPTIEKTFTIMGIFNYAEKSDTVDSILQLSNSK
ncbi:MAG: STAS domain-containing protein [Bacteroidetes bacterium]|nr:STAS domain-containing protein [Bacteroidota bacterium]NCQ11660.1 STAS domain-containing protein [Bacteroidota bacterium]